MTSSKKKLQKGFYPELESALKELWEDPKLNALLVNIQLVLSNKPLHGIMFRQPSSPDPSRSHKFVRQLYNSFGVTYTLTEDEQRRIEEVFEVYEAFLVKAYGKLQPLFPKGEEVFIKVVPVARHGIEILKPYVGIKAIRTTNKRKVIATYLISQEV